MSMMAPSLSVALKLGRISNLPTVWTNTLVGITLVGGSVRDPRMPILLVAMSLFYTGGMYLNDAFDREFDARSRPERPIPAGQISAHAVFTSGFAMLGAALALLLMAGYGVSGGTGWQAPAAGALLVAAIVLYNWHHKANPLSPILMGVCRMLIYLTAALAFADTVDSKLLLAALVLLSYLIGLTYTAKREHLNELGSLWPLTALAVPVVYGGYLATDVPAVWPFLLMLAGWILYALRLLHRRAKGDVPRAVVSLIAGISLLDAVLLAGASALLLSVAAVVAFALTLALQRVVAGT